MTRPLPLKILRKGQSYEIVDAFGVVLVHVDYSDAEADFRKVLPEAHARNIVTWTARRLTRDFGGSAMPDPVTPSSSN